MYPPPNFEDIEVYSGIDWVSATFPHGTELRKIIPYAPTRIERCKSPIPVYTLAYEIYPHKIKVLYADAPRLGVHVIMSGKTMASMVEDGISDEMIHANIVSNGGKLSRIDIAVDVIGSNTFTVDSVYERLGDAVTSLSGHKYIGADEKIETLYLGNMKSRSRRFRVYDKGVEQGVDFKWVRLEYEKRRGADNMAKKMFEGGITPQAIIKGVVDFPSWDEYQKVIGASAYRVMRGDAVRKSDEWVDKMMWLSNSAVPAIADAVKLEYLRGVSDDWTIENSETLNTIASLLSVKLREKYYELFGGE